MINEAVLYFGGELNNSLSQLVSLRAELSRKTNTKYALEREVSKVKDHIAVQVRSSGVTSLAFQEILEWVLTDSDGFVAQQAFLDRVVLVRQAFIHYLTGLERDTTSGNTLNAYYNAIPAALVAHKANWIDDFGWGVDDPLRYEVLINRITLALAKQLNRTTKSFLSEVHPDADGVLREDLDRLEYSSLDAREYFTNRVNRYILDKETDGYSFAEETDQVRDRIRKRIANENERNELLGDVDLIVDFISPQEGSGCDLPTPEEKEALKANIYDKLRRVLDLDDPLAITAAYNDILSLGKNQSLGVELRKDLLLYKTEEDPVYLRLQETKAYFQERDLDVDVELIDGLVENYLSSLKTSGKSTKQRVEARHLLFIGCDLRNSGAQRQSEWENLWTIGTPASKRTIRSTLEQTLRLAGLNELSPYFVEFYVNRLNQLIQGLSEASQLRAERLIELIIPSEFRTSEYNSLISEAELLFESNSQVTSDDWIVYQNAVLKIRAPHAVLEEKRLHFRRIRVLLEKFAGLDSWDSLSEVTELLTNSTWYGDLDYLRLSSELENMLMVELPDEHVEESTDIVDILSKQLFNTSESLTLRSLFLESILSIEGDQYTRCVSLYDDNLSSSEFGAFEKECAIQEIMFYFDYADGNFEPFRLQSEYSVLSIEDSTLDADLLTKKNFLVTCGLSEGSSYRMVYGRSLENAITTYQTLIDSNLSNVALDTLQGALRTQLSKIPLIRWGRDHQTLIGYIQYRLYRELAMFYKYSNVANNQTVKLRIVPRTGNEAEFYLLQESNPIDYSYGPHIDIPRVISPSGPIIPPVITPGVVVVTPVPVTTTSPIKDYVTDIRNKKDRTFRRAISSSGVRFPGSPGAPGAPSLKSESGLCESLTLAKLLEPLNGIYESIDGAIMSINDAISTVNRMIGSINNKIVQIMDSLASMMTIQLGLECGCLSINLTLDFSQLFGSLFGSISDFLIPFFPGLANPFLFLLGLLNAKCPSDVLQQLGLGSGSAGFGGSYGGVSAGGSVSI